MRKVSLFLAAAIMGLVPAFTHAQDAVSTPVTPAPVAMTAASPTAGKTFSDSDRAAIEDIIKDYLVNKHPEVLMQAMQELQKRDQATAEAKSQSAIKTAHDKIYSNPTTPVGGNAKGDVTMVEFFDYQCGYCKMSEESIQRILKEDKNVKFIYKDFPILGAPSVTAAKAALAINKQGTAKYIKFHDLLMAKKDHLTDDMIDQAAKDSGADVDKMKKDMADDDIAKQIQANLDLGNDVGVRGTPMFIVGEQVYPGALQYDQLKKAVDEARTANKK
jgi:protein-disulfide isomerase